MRLRPVRLDDAAFIVWLRGQEHAKGKLGDSATTVSDQERWLESYLDRERDYYWIAETMGGIPVGTNGVYDLTGESAEYGRLIVCPGVPAALPMSLLTYNVAFDRLGLRTLRATSVESNLTLHSFVKKLGYRQAETDLAARVINGDTVNIFNFELAVASWRQQREKLIPLAEYAGSRITEWESKAQNENRYGSKSM